MSADAKVWGQDHDWYGDHDGDCLVQGHLHGPGSLVHIIDDVERCLNSDGIRWQIHYYPNGTLGLRGWEV